MTARPSGLLAGALALSVALSAASPGPRAEDAAPAPPAPVDEFAPLEAYITAGMKTFDTPGLAIAVVRDGEVVYTKGFGVRTKGSADPVDTGTVFAIGSLTKGFLATTLAIAVDRKDFAWDDRIADLDPEFRLKDPWVTGEFRVFDIIAQRSGLPPYANDLLSGLGLDEGELIRSLRHVDPVSSFRTTFAYTNITHLVAGRIVAKAAGLPEWEDVLRRDIFEPLGMTSASATAEAIEAEPDHASGHRWSPEGTVPVPFTPLFPYAYKGAGAINADVADMSRWLRLQLGNGTLEGQTIVSPENLAVTRTARVAIGEKANYAMGWLVIATPNGSVVWHNGGTPAFGTFLGFAPDKGVGVVVLTNAANVGFPDAVGLWTLDRLLGNPEVDYVATAHERATTSAAKAAKMWAAPASPQPPPPLATLAGRFSNPAAGNATVTERDGGLDMTFDTGAVLRLAPWDGTVFTASIAPVGRFAALAENEAPLPAAFVQFQMGDGGTLDVLRLTGDDGQSYPFAREE